MNGPWIPRARWGESSNSMMISRDEEDGTEGWYLQVGWLGWMVSVEFGSIGRADRMMEKYLKSENPS